MIYKDIAELEKLEAGDNIFVIVTPQLVITHNELEFNFVEDMDPANPIYVFKKTKSKELKFIRVETNHKQPIIKTKDIIESVKGYNEYETHFYLVFDSKRDALKEWCLMLDAIHENAKKCLSNVDKFKKAALSSDCVIDYINEFPEDLI